MENSKEAEARRQNLSEILGGFRQKINADAVFLINDRGRVLARAGALYDSSMEVSLLAALMGIYSAAFKVSRIIRQEHLENYHVFRGGDHDLILIPVDGSHALLLAGKGIADGDKILQTVEGMLFVRGDVENVLQSLGVMPAQKPAEPASPKKEADAELEHVSPFIEQEAPPEPEPEVDLDQLFAAAGKKKGVKDVDAFWDDAVEKTGNVPINPDVITFADAEKLGLKPGQSAITNTGPLRSTGQLKKK